MSRLGRLYPWTCLFLAGGCPEVSTLPPPPPVIAAAECANEKPEWLWCDDFEQDRLGRYFEYDRAGGQFVRRSGVGVGGSYGMVATWRPGQVSVGSIHLAVGQTPSAAMRPVDGGTEKYRELFWRLYLKNDSTWTGGGGNKLSRAQILATPDWAQAMIAPVWSGGQGSAITRLMVDPTSGTDVAGTLKTTHYNDQKNLRFLGEANSRSAIFAPNAVGRWYCIEAHVKLNDVGAANGSFDLWIDGVLEASRQGLNWIGSYSDFGINTVFVENYWNAGSPATQSRYFDRLIVATDRIGCS